MADIIDTSSPCVQEFFAFLKANPNLKATYNTAVQALIATIDAQIATAESVIAQLTVAINIQDTILQGYNAIIQGLTSQIAAIPFNEFKTCPGISDLVQFINKNIDPYNLNVTVPFTTLTIKVNVKESLYDQEGRKSYLEFLQSAQKERQALRDFLTKSLTLI